MRQSLRALATAVVCALTLATFAGCELDGASKKQATTAAPVGKQPPSTSLPMPPIESAHGTASRQGGGWTMLDGRRATLTDFRGQVVVLDFYATYCPPCRDEMPHLVELQRRYGQQGLNVVGLNVGGAEDQTKVPEFVKMLGIQYQLGNPDDETIDLFMSGNTSIPQTFVFDREGRVVEHFVGFDAEVAARMESAIQTALASKPSKAD